MGLSTMLNNISKVELVYLTGSWCTGVGPMNFSRMGFRTLYSTGWVAGRYIKWKSQRLYGVGIRIHRTLWVAL